MHINLYKIISDSNITVSKSPVLFCQSTIDNCHSTLSQPQQTSKQKFETWVKFLHHQAKLKMNEDHQQDKNQLHVNPKSNSFKN